MRSCEGLREVSGAVMGTVSESGVHPGQRYKLPSGRVVQVLRVHWHEGVRVAQCGYLRAGRLAPERTDGFGRVSLSEYFLRRRDCLAIRA